MPDSPTLHQIDLATLYLSADLRPTYREQLPALLDAYTRTRSRQTLDRVLATLYAMADAADAYTRREA